jgi:glyoxylase I family protein
VSLEKCEEQTSFGLYQKTPGRLIAVGKHTRGTIKHFPAFAHVGITAKNPAALEAFYTKYFGFRRARVLTGGKNPIVFLKNPEGVYLELFAAEDESPIPPPEANGYRFPGLRHMAFQVDDVDAVLEEMAGDAVISLGPLALDKYAPGWRVVWVKDPEGNIVEIGQGYRDEEGI